MKENRRKPGYVIGIRILRPYFEYLKAIKKYKKDWTVENLADDLVKLMYDYGNPYNGYGLYYTDRTKLYEEEPKLETYDLVSNVEEYHTVRKAKTVIDRHYGDMLQVDLVKLPETKAPAEKDKQNIDNKKYITRKVKETEQTINENEREPGREYFEDLIDEMIEANWGPSVDGYWRNKIKNDSLRELRKEKLNLDVDGKGKAYVDTTRNEVNDYLEVIADVVLDVKDEYIGIPKVNKTRKLWRAADERKAGLRENMNETFYLIISTLWNEWFGVTNNGLDYYALDGLVYADYAKDEAINHFIRLDKVPTEDEVIDFYINHEADLNQVMTRNREIFDNLLDEADIDLMEENELEVISFNREELVEYLKSYGLDDFVEGVIEGVTRYLDENEDEAIIGPDMNKLLEFEEGWIVGISAAKGEDSNIDKHNNQSLAEELTKLGLDFIGPNISMWDGIAEEGFLVNVHSSLNLEKLYDLGNKYKQDWVAVWEAPLVLGKTIIQVDFAENHTKLDGKAYSIVSNDISEYKATNLNEQIINEREGNNMDKIIITGMTYDEMYELAYERAREAYDGPEQYAVDDEYFDELVHDEIEGIYIDEVHEIYDADDLKRWFLDYGWTLDRGYGGPNYKERLAEETNWDLLFDVMLYGGKEKDYMFDGIIYTPVEANDMVLFLEDDFEEEYEDLD